MTAPNQEKLRFYTTRDIDTLPQLQKLSARQRFEARVVAQVLPFRVNNYVVEQLIDWDNVPGDPIYQLTFPQRGMLSEGEFRRVAEALRRGLPADEVKAIANEVRRELNPHPAGQAAHNVPKMDDQAVPGVQHKYRETCLVFPSSGQTCHAYCTFCFRWAQFVGMEGLKFATDESMRFQKYLRRHPEVTDVLFTGGDPMVMSAAVLSRYIEPLLGKGFEHIRTIRIGTKALAYWPYRFVTDHDADDLMGLLERVVSSGKHLAIMAHFNHWKELSTRVVRDAIGRVRSVGAVIRTQSPIVRHINDSASVWVRMWQEQVRLGCVPYYMFIERDTGARRYFEVPLYRAWRVFQKAIQGVSGLCRTARGPSMSALPGKVSIDGVAEVGERQVFVLSFLQARLPAWCKRPFFAHFDPRACWLKDLRPAFGEARFFFEEQLDRVLESRRGGANGDVRLRMYPDRAPGSTGSMG